MSSFSFAILICLEFSHFFSQNTSYQYMCLILYILLNSVILFICYVVLTSRTWINSHIVYFWFSVKW
jgi:hypothetical protein